MASVCDGCQCTAGICRLSSRRTSRLLSGLRYSSRHHRGFDSDQAHHRYNDLHFPIARHLFRLPPRTDSVNQVTFEDVSELGCVATKILIWESQGNEWK